MSQRDVSRLLKVSIKNIKRWIESGAIRKKGGGRKTKDPEMEQELHNWINETCSKGVKLSKLQIKKKAIEISRHKQVFKASKGWLEKFLTRYGLKTKLKFDESKYDFNN